jgi:translation initiation factor 2 beta subunit (eIF-2beta)/eIF-5
MEEIRELIKEWIESWKECKHCNHMVRDTYYSYENKVICYECKINENTLQE